ncbi:malate:quinone oxidoreductase [Neisseria meningitidis]|uniref:malate:quinone oxidoreductase n=1 Tax=Neisseria meningitidis TaxID=487 RepID=UPI00396B3943
MEDVALESSNAWNNAGTGHSALCELNYAPLGANGPPIPATPTGSSPSVPASSSSARAAAR